MSARLLRNQGLFRQPHAGYVHLGREHDNLFRAVAAGILDQVLSQPHCIQHQSTKALFSLLSPIHYQYFPQQSPQAQGMRGLSEIERIQHLLKQKLTDLIPTLAYTLRQIAVSEMVEHFYQYRTFFMSIPQDMELAILRQIDTKMDHHALEALSRALMLGIDLLLCDEVKKGHKRLSYQSEGMYFKLQIKSDGEQYTPYLANPGRYEAIASQRLSQVTPAVHKHHDRQLAEMCKDIQKKDRSLLSEIAAKKHGLEVRLQLGELTLKDLVTLYIEYNQRLDTGVKSEMPSFTKRHEESAGNPSYEERLLRDLVNRVSWQMSIAAHEDAAIQTTVAP